MDDLLRQIDAGNIAPVYCLFGEAFPCEELVGALRRSILSAGPEGFNLDVFDAKAFSAPAVLAAARTLPMFGARRLVQVRDIDQIAVEHLSQLLPYCEAPNPSTCLLLTGKKLDLRTRFATRLKTCSVLARFDPLKPRQAPDWVQQEARRRDVKLAAGAAHRIVDAVGTDQAQLVSAIERLALYVGDANEPITPQHVEHLLAQTRQRSIFELTDAVGRGERDTALAVLRQMIADREPGTRIVVMLQRHLRQLWLARVLSQQRLSRDALATRIGVHPFLLRELLAQANRFSPQILRRTHRLLLEAELALKSSRLREDLILSRLVLSL